jgi:hypothetical protein
MEDLKFSGESRAGSNPAGGTNFADFCIIYDILYSLGVIKMKTTWKRKNVETEKRAELIKQVKELGINVASGWPTDYLYSLVITHTAAAAMRQFNHSHWDTGGPERDLKKRSEFRKTHSVRERF